MLIVGQIQLIKRKLIRDCNTLIDKYLHIITHREHLVLFVYTLCSGRFGVIDYIHIDHCFLHLALCAEYSSHYHLQEG